MSSAAQTPLEKFKSAKSVMTHGRRKCVLAVILFGLMTTFFLSYLFSNSYTSEVRSRRNRRSSGVAGEVWEQHQQQQAENGGHTDPDKNFRNLVDSTREHMARFMKKTNAADASDVVVSASLQDVLKKSNAAGAPSPATTKGVNTSSSSSSSSSSISVLVNRIVFDLRGDHRHNNDAHEHNDPGSSNGEGAWEKKKQKSNQDVFVQPKVENLLPALRTPPPPPPRAKRKPPGTFLFLSDFSAKSYNSNNLYSPKCRLSTENIFDGGCKPNPFYTPTRTDLSNPKREHVIHEMQCSARKSQRELLKLGGVGAGGDEQLETNVGRRRTSAASATSPSSAPSADVILDFKRHTSWMFDKWYDWDAKCSSAADTNNDGVLRGAHVGDDDVYQLENFCLKPMGRLSGFFPKQQQQQSADKNKQKVAGAGPSSSDTMKPFLGVHEAYKVNGVDSNVEGGMAHFLKNHDRLDAKPSCFLDTKIIITGLTMHSENSGHIAHRTASLLRFIELVYGEKARDQLEDVTIVYLVTALGFAYVATPEANNRINVQKYFYDSVGTSWMSIFSSVDEGVIDAWEDHLLRTGSSVLNVTTYTSTTTTTSTASTSIPSSGSSTTSTSSSSVHHHNNINNNNPFFSRKALLDTPVCFRKGFVWMNAHEKHVKGKNFEASADVPGHKTSFHLFGPRTMRDVDTLNMLNRRLRQCCKQRDLLLPTTTAPSSSSSSSTSPSLRMRREHPNAASPHVLMTVRSAHRRFSLQPHLINFIASFVRKELNGTFEVAEHVALDFDEIIERFSRADILIGMLGAGLLWLEFMPPGAVVIEFNGPRYRCAINPGINQNVNCDFGGSAVAAQLYHLTFNTPVETMLRFRYDPNNGARIAAGANDIAAGPSTFAFLLTKAKCLLDSRAEFFNISVAQQTTPGRCDFGKSDLVRVATADVKDERGETVSAFAQMFLPSTTRSTTKTTTTTTTNNTTPSSVAPISAEQLGTDFRNDDESTSRMKLMIRNAKKVAALASRFRPAQSLQNPASSAIKMLLVVDCEAESTNVLNEIWMWRGILRDVYDVTVKEMGREGDCTTNAALIARRRRNLKRMSLFNNGIGTSTGTTTAAQAWAGVRRCRDFAQVHKTQGCDQSQNRAPYHIIVRTSLERAGKRYGEISAEVESAKRREYLTSAMMVKGGMLLSFERPMTVDSTFVQVHVDEFTP